MAKKTFDVYGAWKIVCKDQLAFRRARARKCVQEPLICVLFILLSVLLAVPAYYMVVVEQVVDGGSVPIQIPLLWQINDWFWGLFSDPERVTFMGYAAVMVIPFAVCVAIGLPWRLISKACAPIAIRNKEESLPEDYLGQLEAINKKIAAIPSVDPPAWGIVTLIGVLVSSLAGCAISMVVAIHGKLDISNVLVISFILQGLQFGCSVLLGFFVRLITFCRRPYPHYESIADDAGKALRAEQKAIKQQQEEQQRQALYNQGADAFFAGDYKTAKQILSNVHFKDSADAEALVLLSSDKKDKSIESVRKTYGQLWKAWEKGFRDPRVREATKTALDIFILVIDEAAQPDMLKAFACFLASDWMGVSNALETHVKYSYPDAVALDIVCRTMDHRNDPDKYPEWLKALKTAKQRRISEMYLEVCDELIGKMENAIRENEAQKNRIAEERRRREASYTPPYSTYGGLPPWAEPSGWTDFRTGEPLYRVDGRIVNANGEEVSVAWWD